MNKSFIISYRESSDERSDNLKMVLDYLYWLMDSNSEIILVEQDSESKVIKWIDEVKSNKNIKHIFIKNTGIFNKGWGYNIGAKMAESNNLIFHDADMLLKIESYKHSLNLLNRFDVVNPYKSIVYLSEETKNTLKQNNYNFSVTKLHSPVISHVITGGIFIMRKDKFLEIKGFDENCYGYGHEDDILDVKIKKMGLSLQVVNDISIHIYHDNEIKDGEYYSFIELNKLLFAQYEKYAKSELINKIENVDVFGDINRNKDNDVDFSHIRREMYKSASEKILDNVLNRIDDRFIDEIISDISGKIYNQIIESISEKIKKELGDIKYTPEEKKNTIRKILNKLGM
jgi:glycosyl transferase family 2